MPQTSQSITGKHWQSGDWITVAYDKQSIVSIEPSKPSASDQVWLAPSILDLQVNGYGGIDFQQSNLTESDLLSACHALRRDGCACFFLTLITAPWNDLLENLRHLKAIRDSNPFLRSCIKGWHIEGPFLSEEPGYCGAHDTDCMEDPSPDKMMSLKKTIGEDRALLTLAPERPGSLDTIKKAVELGIRISLGHTNANASTLKKALETGAAGFTHLGNACPQQLDRHDNLVFRVLDSGPWMTGIIPDGIHVSPALFRIFHRVIPSQQIYYTTDAMSAAGAVPGRYKIKDIELEVGADQIVRQPGKSNFAGSALKPGEGITRAANMLNTNWRNIWKHFSEIPSLWMQLPNAIEIGASQSFSVITELPGNGLNIRVNQP